MTLAGSVRPHSYTSATSSTSHAFSCPMLPSSLCHLPSPKPPSSLPSRPHLSSHPQSIIPSPKPPSSLPSRPHLSSHPQSIIPSPKPPSSLPSRPHLSSHPQRHTSSDGHNSPRILHSHFLLFLFCRAATISSFLSLGFKSIVSSLCEDRGDVPDSAVTWTKERISFLCSEVSVVILMHS